MPTALTLVLVAIVAWLTLGAAGLAVPRRLRFISHVLFPASALVALLLAIVALGAIGNAPQTAVLPLGLLRLDKRPPAWILQVASWDHERYVIVETGSDDNRLLIEAFGGRCPRPE